MSSYTSNLKSWGANGQEYPDGYNYVEGEQPVDAWDNYLTSNLISDIDHLVSLTNDRLETDSGDTEPTSPEPGHLFYDTDGSETTEPEFKFYDNDSGTFHRLLKAGGDVMTGVLDMGGYNITETGDISASKDSASLKTSGSGSGQWGIHDTTTGEDSVLVKEGEYAEVDGSSIAHEWFRNHDGGSVGSDSLVPIGTFQLQDSESLEVTQATFTADGFTTPVSSDLDLIIVPETASTESDTTKVLSGDGATLFDGETGSPLASYTNTSGAVQTVAIGIDNGHFNTGAGVTKSAFGSYIARVV